MGQMKHMWAEYVENNDEFLTEKFIEENKKDFEEFKSKTHYNNEDDVIDWFLEEKEDEWAKFTMEEFTNHEADRGDMLYDAWKDRDAE